MTEQEWLASDDPQAMLGWWCEWVKNLPRKPSDVKMAYRACVRRLRLFVAAALSVVLPSSTLPPRVLAIADGSPITAEDESWWPTASDIIGAVNCATLASRKPEHQARLAALLREIVGNPFRPLVIPPAALAWNDRAVPRLAQAIYDENDWSQERLGILADVCEEAGIEDEFLIHHLRGEEWCPCRVEADRITRTTNRFAVASCERCHGSGWQPLRGPHVRGCFVVDALIGKE